MSDTQKTSNMLVACHNDKGEPDMFYCTFNSSDKGLTNQTLHELAIEKAKQNGFLGPFIIYGPKDQTNIAKHVEHLECPIPFSLEDKSTEDQPTSITGNLVFGWDGLSMKLNGFSDYHSDDDLGIIGFLEHYNGSAYLRAYANITIDEPTHNILLDDARNEVRTN